MSEEENTFKFWESFRSLFLISFIIPLVVIFIFSSNSTLNAIGGIFFVFLIVLIMAAYYETTDKMEDMMVAANRTPRNDENINFSLADIDETTRKSLKYPWWHFPAAAIIFIIIVLISLFIGLLFA